LVRRFWIPSVEPKLSSLSSMGPIAGLSSEK
jgi:hypothetical protein